jgi:adenylate cyclase
MPLGLFHYQLLTGVLEKIHFIYDEEELADTILSGVASALNAEGGSVFKIMPDGSIYPLAAYGATVDSLRKIPFSVGKGVVGWVAEYAQPVKVDDPMRDKRFMEASDSSTGFKTRSILAAPILGRGKPVGVIEFLNRKGGPFAAPDLELISMVGREIGIAFENVALFKKLEESRAFQESIVNSLSAGIVMVDLQFRLRRMNPIAQKLLWLELKENEEIFPPAGDVLRSYPELIQVLRDLAASDSPHTTKKIRLQVGKMPVELWYYGVPILSKGGERLGTALLLQDSSMPEPK